MHIKANNALSAMLVNRYPIFIVTHKWETGILTSVSNAQRMM